MTFYEGLMNVIEWAWDLINNIPALFAWLFTDISILGLTVKPVYLVGAGFLLIGIIRAITGSIID